MNNQNKNKDVSDIHLEKCSISELKNIAKEMDIFPSKNRNELIDQISCAFKEWKNYKEEKVKRYERIKTLGNKGREARTYLVFDKKTKREYAQKQYRKNKSSDAIRREYDFQEKSYKKNISPKPIDYDTIAKTITMEKMEYDLIDLIRKQKGKLTRNQQTEILDLFDSLDEIGIFHADSNALNLMYTIDNKLKIIDFGFAMEINSKTIKKYGTKTPNKLYLTMGLVLQLRRFFPTFKFTYLEKIIDSDLLEKFIQVNPISHV